MPAWHPPAAVGMASSSRHAISVFFDTVDGSMWCSDGVGYLLYILMLIGGNQKNYSKENHIF
jgi:hypothetical protein